MLEMTFQEFRKGKYPDQDTDERPDSYGLYVIKNDKVLYVGISTDVWYRWFGSSRAHTPTNIYGDLYGTDYIGREVVENLPQSLRWKVELWNRADCLNYFEIDIPEYYFEERLDFKYFEIQMIRKRSPFLNVQHNWKE